MNSRTTLRIARLELSTLFYSPVAWLVLIIFTFQSCLSFTNWLEFFDRFQKMNIETEPVTNGIFSSAYRFFFSVKNNLYLYIPLLTMGLISREVSSGSIKLIYSSPVTIRGMVLGKYFAIMIYGLLLAGVLCLFAVAGFFAIELMDVKLVVSGIFALYLLICAYAAIGLFMSSLSSYQVVAAISTLVVLAALSFVGTLGQTVPILKDLTYFLSISGRTDKMISGLISTKDVLYFVIVIFIFLGLTILKLQNGLESRHVTVKAMRYVALISAALLLGYISGRPRLIGYLDMTRSKIRSLTVNSQAIVKKMDKPLKITTYVNLFDPYHNELLPAQRNADWDRFEQYTRFLPDMKMSYVYYYDTTENPFMYQSNPGLTQDSLAKRMAEAEGLELSQFMPPAEIKKVIDLTTEENRDIRLVEYDGKKAFLRFFADNEHHPGEPEITAVLKKLTAASPKVAFLTGNDERSINKTGDKEYNTVARKLSFRQALINQGFTVDTINLTKTLVPADIAVLVIADPRASFTTEEQLKIQQYINDGGNVLIAGEPGRQHIINPIISMLGVQLKEGMLIEQSKDFEPQFLLTGFSEGAGKRFPELEKMRQKGAKLSMPGGAALSYTPNEKFVGESLIVVNDSTTWNTVRKINADSVKVNYQPEYGDIKNKFPVAISLTRALSGKEQRIMVLGDADMISNGELFRENIQTENFGTSLEIFKWFSYGDLPVTVDRDPPKDKLLIISKTGISWIKVTFLGIIPAVFIILGSIILIRRKRK